MSTDDNGGKRRTKLEADLGSGSQLLAKQSSAHLGIQTDMVEGLFDGRI
jgi:hypothetical protein